ncbi:MAG: hypothetical protein RLZZ458_389 [Planctomycetota bacterium]
MDGVGESEVDRSGELVMGGGIRSMTMEDLDWRVRSASPKPMNQSRSGEAFFMGTLT